MAKKAKSQGSDKKKLLETARTRFAKCVEADRANRRLAVDDLEFLHEPGKQWDEEIRKERGKRPCYEFNRARVTAKRIINDIRANRPQGKVRAVEDGDKATSAVMEGLCRNIWNVSDGDAAIDNAAEYQVGGGMGAWRVSTKYSTDDAWDQDIVIEPIRNPFALWRDPNARDPMGRDAEYWFLESRMPKASYEERYGDVSAVEWESSEFDDDEEWEGDESVRIAEYWYHEPVSKTLGLLESGETIELTGDPSEALLPIIRKRQVRARKVMSAIISADKVLEGPNEWAGSKFPFVMVYGEFAVIDGKTKWWGITRHAKDAQRMHNAMLTNALETAALAPQAKWWATATQAQGLDKQWADAHKQNFPFLLYNADPLASGPPQAMNGAQVPVAFTNLAMFTGEEIKATTGIFDASLGNKSNETTGIAIRQRQAQAEIATFNYGDNLARGIRYTWELLLDLIPKVYDTERTVRVIGQDGMEDYARINSVGPDGQMVNDVSRGKYDTTVTVGPSFSTRRQEAAEVYSQFAQANPAILQVGGDLIFRSLDLPYAEEMAERMQTMLPPPIQQQIAAKKQNNGQPLPPEVTMAMQQAEQAMQQAQMHGQLVQEAAAELEQSKLEADKAKAEVQKLIADLKVQEANLKAAEAQLQADIVQARAELAEREMALTAQGKDIEHAGSALEQQATMAGQQSAVEIVQQAVDAISQQIKTLEQRMSQAPQQPIVINPPRIRGIKRTNGGHQVEYDE